MHLVYRQSCRVCGSKSLTKVIDLGEQHLQGSFVKPGKEMPPMRKIPMVLLRCNPSIDEGACGLLQLAHTVPPSILYGAYWYRSGTNRTMTDHLSGIADEACEMMGRRKNSRVLDVGCNDGTLLKAYPSNFLKFGVDPSDVSKEISSDINVVQDLFPSIELKKLTKGEPFDVITSIAMFYDLEDPVAFVGAVKESLSKQGIWIFEMSYMPTMLSMNSYDTICHEHLEYYSFAVIERILAVVGMKVVRAVLNDSNGGSIRCYATHEGNIDFSRSEFADNIRSIREKEFDMELDTDKPYKNFQENINSHKDELLTVLKGLKDEGKKIHIYGASTKGNTILQFCGIDKSIVDFAAERNPDKYGARTLGTDIPIISEEESRALDPDYYLVLPWHFKAEFLDREKETIDRGVGMIFPLPKVEIVQNIPEYSGK